MKVLFGILAGLTGITWPFLFIDWAGRATGAAFQSINRPIPVTADSTLVTVDAILFFIFLVLSLVFHSLEKNRDNEN